MQRGAITEKQQRRRQYSGSWDRTEMWEGVRGDRRFGCLEIGADEALGEDAGEDRRSQKQKTEYRRQKTEDRRQTDRQMRGFRRFRKATAI